MSTKLPSGKGENPALRADLKLVFALLWQERLALKDWETFLQSIREGKIDLSEVMMISEEVVRHEINANEAGAMLNELLAA